MKKGIVLAGVLLVSFLLFAGIMTVAGVALRYSAQDTVLTFTQSQETLEPKKDIQFPYPIPGTTMTVENLVIYDGPLVDHNNDAPIVNGLAMRLHNTGGQELLTIEITLKLTDAEYRFTGSHIPAGASVLLPALDNALWSELPCTECTGWAICAEDSGLSETDVEISETDMGGLSVTNRTEGVLYDVQLLYKNFLPEAELFMGSQTFSAWIGMIQPGQSVSVLPQRYAGSYSKIVRIEGKSRTVNQCG